MNACVTISGPFLAHCRARFTTGHQARDAVKRLQQLKSVLYVTNVSSLAFAVVSVGYGGYASRIMIDARLQQVVFIEVRLFRPPVRVTWCTQRDTPKQSLHHAPCICSCRGWQYMLVVCGLSILLTASIGFWSSRVVSVHALLTHLTFLVPMLFMLVGVSVVSFSSLGKADKDIVDRLEPLSSLRRV